MSYKIASPLASYTVDELVSSKAGPQGTAAYDEMVYDPVAQDRLSAEFSLSLEVSAEITTVILVDLSGSTGQGIGQEWPSGESYSMADLFYEEVKALVRALPNRDVVILGYGSHNGDGWLGEEHGRYTRRLSLDRDESWSSMGGTIPISSELIQAIHTKLGGYGTFAHTPIQIINISDGLPMDYLPLNLSLSAETFNAPRKSDLEMCRDWNRQYNAFQDAVYKIDEERGTSVGYKAWEIVREDFGDSFMAEESKRTRRPSRDKGMEDVWWAYKIDEDHWQDFLRYKRRNKDTGWSEKEMFVEWRHERNWENDEEINYYLRYFDNPESAKKWLGGRSKIIYDHDEIYCEGNEDNCDEHIRVYGMLDNEHIDYALNGAGMPEWDNYPLLFSSKVDSSPKYHAETFNAEECKGTTQSGHEVEWADGSIYIEFAEPIRNWKTDSVNEGRGYTSVTGDWYGGDNESPDKFSLTVTNPDADYADFTIDINDVEYYGVSQNKQNRWQIDGDYRGNAPDIFVDMSDDLVAAIEEGLNWMVGDFEEYNAEEFGAQTEAKRALKLLRRKSSKQRTQNRKQARKVKEDKYGSEERAETDSSKGFIADAKYGAGATFGVIGALFTGGFLMSLLGRRS